jgi:hypothetical protein
MYKLIVLIFISLIVLSCKSDKDELSICETTCDNETVTNHLDDVCAKVFINNTYTDDDGKIYTVYAITINPDDLDTNTRTVSSDFILAPCNLPNRYKKENLNIVVSGNRKSCCNQFTQPNWRYSYGCKFEITEIRNN